MRVDFCPAHAVGCDHHDFVEERFEAHSLVCNVGPTDAHELSLIQPGRVRNRRVWLSIPKWIDS